MDRIPVSAVYEVAGARISISEYGTVRSVTNFVCVIKTAYWEVVDDQVAHDASIAGRPPDVRQAAESLFTFLFETGLYMFNKYPTGILKISSDKAMRECIKSLSKTNRAIDHFPSQPKHLKQWAKMHIAVLGWGTIDPIKLEF